MLELVVEQGWPTSGWEDYYGTSWSAASTEFGKGPKHWQRLPRAALAHVAMKAWLVERAPMTAEAHAEVPLADPAGLVVGTADLVTSGNDGGTRVHDLKTGAPAHADDSAVREQLLLYGALLAESGTAVAGIGLLSASGQHWDEPFDMAVASDVLERHRAAAQAAARPTRPDGTPSTSRCPGCTWLAGCEEGQALLLEHAEPVRVRSIDERHAGTSVLVERSDQERLRVEPIRWWAGDQSVGVAGQLVTIDGEHGLLTSTDLQRGMDDEPESAQ